MEGTIIGFRRSRRVLSGNQMIIIVDTIDSKEKAEKLVGKSVMWHAPGKNKKVLSGKVTAIHGGKGAVRVLFDSGMPGQSLGTKVKLE